MNEPILTGDYAILYSDIQDAYHVETMAQYREKGRAGGNWLIVDRASDYVTGLIKVGERRDQGRDKADR